METLHPGVYTLELPSAVRPIEGVSTSTAAFIGFASKGPVPGTTLPNGQCSTTVAGDQLHRIPKELRGISR